jgi:hypothetical protein
MICKFLLQSLILQRRQNSALAAVVNERAGRTGGVVEQRLVPASRCVMGVEGNGGRFKWTQTVVISSGLKNVRCKIGGKAAP